MSEANIDNAHVTANAAGAKDQADGQDPSEKSGAQEAGKFSQADLDRIVKERLERERAKAQKEAEAAAQAAEEKRLAESQEWQKLAESREREVAKLKAEFAELEAARERSEKYAAALGVYRDALAEGLPDDVMALLAEKDVADQLEWLTANAAKYKSGQNGAGYQAPRVPSTPNGSRSPAMDDDEKRRRAYRPRL